MKPGKVRGINHITLDVTNLPRSLRFYCEVLGCELRSQWVDGAYLEAGSVWICLQVNQVEISSGSGHIAFDVSAEDFPLMAQRLKADTVEWKANSSEGESLYLLDPDGHRLEIHVGSLESRLAAYRFGCVPEGYREDK